MTKFANVRDIILVTLLCYLSLTREYLRGKYHCTVDLLFDWFGISCVITDNFCFYLQNRLIQTGETGGQQYSDTSPFSIPCSDLDVQQTKGGLVEQKLKLTSNSRSDQIYNCQSYDFGYTLLSY